MTEDRGLQRLAQRNHGKKPLQSRVHVTERYAETMTCDPSAIASALTVGSLMMP